MKKRTGKILTVILSVATVVTATFGAVGLGGTYSVSAQQTVSTANLITGYSQNSVSVNAATTKGDVTGILVSPMDRSAGWSADINATFTGNSSITYALPDMADTANVPSDSDPEKGDWTKQANAFSVKKANGDLVATFITFPRAHKSLGNQSAYMYNAVDDTYTMPYHSWDATNRVDYWTNPLNYRTLSSAENAAYGANYAIKSLSALRISPSTGVTTVAADALDSGSATGTLYFDYTDGVLTVKTSSYDMANTKREDQTGNGQTLVMGTVNVDLSEGYTVSMHNAPAFGKEGDPGYLDHFMYSSSVLVTAISGVDVTSATVQSEGGAATDIRYDGEKVVGGKNTIYLREGQALAPFDVYGPFVVGGTVHSATTAAVRTLSYTAKDFATAAVGSYPITVTDGAFSKAYTVVVQKEYKVAVDTVINAGDNAKVTTEKTVGDYTGIYISRITDAEKARTATIDGVFHGDASISYLFDGSIANKTEAHGITVYDRDGNAVCTVVNYWVQAWQGGGSRAYVKNEITGVKTHVSTDGGLEVMTDFVPNVWTGMHIGPIPLTSPKDVNFDGTRYEVLTAEGTVYFEYDEAEKTLTVKMDTVQKTKYIENVPQNIKKVNVLVQVSEGKEEKVYTTKIDESQFSFVYHRDAAGNQIYQTDGNGDFVYQKNADGSDKLDSKGNPIKIPMGIMLYKDENGDYKVPADIEANLFPVTGTATAIMVEAVDENGDLIYKYGDDPYNVSNPVPVVTVGIIENVDLSNGYTVEFNQPNDFNDGDGKYTDCSKSVLITSINGHLTNEANVLAVSEGLCKAELWGDTYVFDLAAAEKPVLYYAQNNPWANVSVTAVKRLESDWAVYETLEDVQVEGTYDLTTAGSYDIVLKGEKDGIPYSQAVVLTVETSRKITLDEDGGVALDDIYISEHSYVRSLPTPERIGWEFTGWYNGTTKVTEITQETQAMTLKAQWLDEVVPVISLNNLEAFTVVDDSTKFVISKADVIAEDMACGLLEGNYITIQVKAPGGNWVALENFTFDKTKYGEYEVNYTVKDWSNNTATVSRIIKYTPVRPTLTVNGEVPTDGFVGATITLPTATATSGATALAVSVSVAYNGKAVTMENNAFVPEEAGTYAVCYQVKDSVGQIASKNFDIVVVSDTEKPQIQVEFTQYNVVVGRKLELPLATATDNADDNVQISVVIRKGGEDIATESTILNEVGVYLVVYTATDFAGNVSSVTFEVFVREETDRLPNSFDSGEVPPLPEVDDNSGSGDNSTATGNGSGTGGDNASNANNGGCGGCGSSLSLSALGALTTLMGAALFIKKKKN